MITKGKPHELACALNFHLESGILIRGNLTYPIDAYI